MSSHESRVVPSPHPPAVKETQLVDRVEEMELLKEAVNRAIQGQGGLVFLHGEAGIGKTRLARELGAYARMCGMQVLYGRCPALFRMEGVVPYVLWSEVIRDYLDNSSLEQLYRVIGFYPAEVTKLVPELVQKLRAIPQSFPISPEQEQNRLFEAVSQFITNISKETPLLVILDDLQWTDASSLLLLHYLTRGVYRTPLLLLGAYRSTDVEAKHPLTPVLAELNRERLLQSVSLKRMSPSNISEMIRQILEQDFVPMEFCELVYEKTRGNPFFAEEVVKSLKEEEVIFRENDKWKIKEVSRIELPETVKSIIRTRIIRLDDESQKVLTMASVVGNDFTLDALQKVIGLDESNLRKILDQLLKTGLLKRRIVRGEDVCSFADIIMRDVVYEEVGTFERKKLHSNVGTALEKAYAGKVDEHFGELAYHFLEGGDKDRALGYFLKAGDKAAKICANAEAISYYQSSLKLLEQKGGELSEKGRVLEQLGDIKKLVGEYDACMKYWGEATLLFKQLNEKETVARLYRKTANVLWSSQGQTEKAKIYHEDALKILGREPESAELASLFDDMARLYLRTEDVPKARSWAEKALELAEKVNAYEVIASSYSNLGDALSLAEDMKKGAEYYERALKIALDNSYTETAIRAYSSLSTLLPSLEVLGAMVNEERLEHLEKAYELAKKAGDIHWVSSIGTDLADAYIGMGNMNKAILLAEESIGLDRKTGNIINLSHSMNELGFLYGILGEWDKSEQQHKEALSLVQKAKDTQQIMMALFNLGQLYIMKGEWVKTREYLERLIEVAEKTGARSIEYWSKCCVPWAYVEMGEIEKAKKLLDNVLKFAFETNDIVLMGCADSIMAMSFRAQKKWKESIAFFEKSLKEYEAYNASRFNVYWFARQGLYEYARMYLERDRPGDREKARNLLNQALEMLQKTGAKKDVEKVEAKLLYIETGKLASVPKPTELVAIGYADLDKLLCGGIPQNYAVVLTSPSCDERDMLIKSFLEAGAKKGEVTFYVTIDPGLAKNLANEFQSSFYLFVCNPQAEAIVKSSSNIFTLKGVENLTDISIALTSAIRKLDPVLKGPRRICLGLVSDVLLQHHGVQTRKWLTALTTELNSMDFTTLAVVDPRMHPPEELYAIIGLFEGEINLYEKETEKGSEKFLRIKKMSNQEYLENELLLKKADLQKRK